MRDPAEQPPVDAKPATPELITELIKGVRDLAEHDHPVGSTDWHCINLAAYMGERMGPVLALLHQADDALADARRALDRTRHEVARVQTDSRNRHRRVLALRDKKRAEGDEGRARGLERVAGHIDAIAAQLGDVLAELPEPQKTPGT
ncbi:hypothetical protein [Actinomadura nitritigenes]|uniref:hypothetical protein n=1 Tax=Actinomadura nitritigenes TaxID=134602 RepID=UPI003D8A9277